MRIPKPLSLRNCGGLPGAAALVLLGALAAGAADYPTTVLTDGPVLYLRFEEPVGTTNLVDSSGQGSVAKIQYPLNATNPILAQLGLQSNAFNFLGTATAGQTAGRPGTIDVNYRPEFAPVNSYGLTTTNGYALGGPFSVECWTRSFVKRTDGAWEGVVGVASNNRSGSVWPKAGGYMLGKDNNGRWAFLMRNGVSTLTSQTTPQLLQWYHLVATFDGTNAALYVNGELQSSNTGNTNYVTYNYDNNNTRTVNIGNSRYSDSPWNAYKGEIDEVALYTNVLSAARIQAHYQAGTNAIVLPPQPPVVLTDLTNTTAFANTSVTLGLTAGGDQPLSYQWLRNGAQVNGATNSTLTFTAAFPDDEGATFSMIITNRSGVTNSAVATLTVSTDLLTANCPEDLTPLQSLTRYVGSYAAFRPVAYGAQPIGYQWSRDGEALAGQTAATLWLTNVQKADDGASFSVLVTNPWNSVTLTATLAVGDRPVTVPLDDSYGALVAADRPVAYWRLNEPANSTTAFDAVGSFDASLTNIFGGNSGPFTWELAPGIPGATDFAMGINNGAILSIPYANELNPDTTWSAETWVQPSELSPNASVNYVVFSSEYNHSTSIYNDWNGWYVSHGSARTFNFVPEPYGGAGFGAGPDDPANNNQIVAGQWYHLVVSKDATNFNLYLNGKLRASRPVATTPFIPNGTGIRPENGRQGHGETMIGSLHDKTRTPFAGLVDETAFYNYALSSQQVLKHYLNSTNITPPTVTIQLSRYDHQVVLTWSQGTLQSAPAVGGPYTDLPSATSPYTNAIGASTFFRVKVQ